MANFAGASRRTATRRVNSKVAILGGGMLGLTTALRLAQRGHAVTVIEAQPEIGGLTAGFAHDDVRWDRFYHVIEQSDADLLAYAEALEHPTMRQVYDLLGAVQFQIMADRFEVLGTRMAELHPAEEL